jgi:hypothetical protein
MLENFLKIPRMRNSLEKYFDLAYITERSTVYHTRISQNLVQRIKPTLIDDPGGSRKSSARLGSHDSEAIQLCFYSVVSKSQTIRDYVSNSDCYISNCS